MTDTKSIPRSLDSSNPVDIDNEHAAEQSTNHVNASDGYIVQQPDNSNIGGKVDDSNLSTQRQQDLLDSEKLRRRLFWITVAVALFIIACLYGTLIYWIIYWIYKSAQLPYIFGGSNEVWHIATILALPPTTILFLLVKVLSKNTEQNNNDNNQPINIKDMPMSEWLFTTKKVIGDIMDAFKGKK